MRFVAIKAAAGAALVALLVGLGKNVAGGTCGAVEISGCSHCFAAGGPDLAHLKRHRVPLTLLKAPAVVYYHDLRDLNHSETPLLSKLISSTVNMSAPRTKGADLVEDEHAALGEGGMAKEVHDRGEEREELRGGAPRRGPG